MKLNNELLRFASPSAEGMVRFDMARAAALKADLAMLEGSGTTQIKGVITYSGITAHTAGTVGTNGNTFTPADVADMEAKLPDAVDAPTAWVMRKAMFAALLNRRADAVSAADAKGPFLFRDTRSLGADRPVELFGTKVVRSSQVANNRVKGTGTSLTYILLGHFPDWRVRGPPETPKGWNRRRLREVHRSHRGHKPARFPPHSVHHSVHRKTRCGRRLDTWGEVGAARAGRV